MHTAYSISSLPPPIEWNETYGGSFIDGASAFQQTSDGGYIVAGIKNMQMGSTSDAWLFKTDSYGNMQWEKTYTPENLNRISSIALTNDGGYVLAGDTEWRDPEDNVFRDALLIKTYSNGTAEWIKRYRVGKEDSAYSVVQNNNGDYVFVGTTDYLVSGYWESDLLLVKVNGSGNMQWTRTWGYGYHDYGDSIIQTNDGQYAVLGTASVPGTGFDLWLTKVDDSGNIQWNKTYGRPGGSWEDYAKSFAQTNDGGFMLAGYIVKTYPREDTWLIKTDDSGNVQWNKTYGTGGEHIAACVLQTNDGGYVLAGFDWPGYGDSDAWVVKTDDSGEILWEEVYGGGYEDGIEEMRQTNDEGYIMVGGTSSFSGGSGDAWLVKLKGLAHDVALTNALPSKTIVGQGYNLNINVTAANQGNYTETFNVTSYANTTAIGTQMINLTSGNSTTIAFTWDTTGYAKGNYTVWAYAKPVSGETDTADDTFTYGTVTITIPGDVDGNFAVTILDVVLITSRYMKYVPQFWPGPPVLPIDNNCDINGDGTITILDVVICTSHYGEKYP